MEEIKRRGGAKVFYADSHVADNDKVLAGLLAFKGKSVLISSDKNKTARSLQFGDNSGKFQHGATQLIHADMPQNNADTARMSRPRGRGCRALAGRGGSRPARALEGRLRGRAGQATLLEALSAQR